MSESLNYFSFFNVRRCIYASCSAAILCVDFNLFDQTLGLPKDAVLKVKYDSSQGESRESLISEKVSNLHPLFPEFYFYQRDEDLGFLFTEFCSTSSLDNTKFANTKLFPYEKMKDQQLAYTVKSLAKALFLLHNEGISHRDFKLQNVCVTIENYLKLIDFGSAKYSCDSTETITFTEIYSSPQLKSRIENRDTKKDDMWAFGIFLLVLCSGGEFPSQSDLQLPRSQTTLPIIENLKISPELKSIISKCLIEDEQDRADSYTIYKLSKDYCENSYKLYKNSSLSEKLYYEMIGYNFISKSGSGQDVNCIKKFTGRKNKCLICSNNEPVLKKYRKFHKVHQKCLLNQLKQNLSSPYCLICNNFGSESEVKNNLDKLTVNILTYKDCHNPKVTIKDFNQNRSANRCNHFISALTKNYKSVIFMCDKVRKTFCTLCSKSEYHIHCAGYCKHLENYNKIYLINQDNNTKVYLLKYKLVYWQKVLKEPRFREYQIMKEIEITKENLSSLHIYDYCCTFNDNFVFLDFWNSKSNNIRAFFEYMEDGSLYQEYSYRNQNNIKFEDEELELYQSFIQDVTSFLETNSIHHAGISLASIYIQKSSGKITKFKLSGMKHLNLSTFENGENLEHANNLSQILQHLKNLHNP